MAEEQRCWPENFHCWTGVERRCVVRGLSQCLCSAPPFNGLLVWRVSGKQLLTTVTITNDIFQTPKISRFFDDRFLPVPLPHSTIASIAVHPSPGDSPSPAPGIIDSELLAFRFRDTESSNLFLTGPKMCTLAPITYACGCRHPQSPERYDECPDRKAGKTCTTIKWAPTRSLAGEFCADHDPATLL